ncbi:DUF445 domain-containing protein [Bacillus canaveralius]|uniref:DUF445 domain-containing protein n=1 Tax=Bacillus canaveralius TaxID=1403243 RepID=A0A2N5GKP7_9BACI|nr:DUF445 domain-containing protein [Bacillus canaveralius]PLR82094.1 DUF445 domain-containing protein [Bacillus canaveralius]PLR98000.1 DUF445 domain-containing protein [Bacillus canaveralius]RSK54419.1 DUF445 domain-containing protein [Bacillus canaveralius]
MAKQSTRSKYLATISLIIMGSGFLVSIPVQDHIIGRLLHGGFEAGLVGGLADWFAVTALFRHPLGVPIPHTALLPKNRDKMVSALIHMLENNWLTKESIREKLNEVEITKKLIPIIETEIRSEPIKKGAVSIMEQIIRSLDAEKISPFLEKELKDYLYRIDAGKILHSGASQVIAKRYDEKTIDYLLAELEKWAAKEDAKEKMGSIAMELLENTKSDGFMQFALQSLKQFINKEKLGQILQSFLMKRIPLLREPDNEYRQIVLTRIRTELADIDNRKELVKEINDWKEQIIDDWRLSGQITELLLQAQQRAVKFINEETFYHQYIFPLMKRFIDDLKTDPAKINAIENWLQKQIAELIESNHSKIGKLVKENLDKLDTESLIHMMENNVGKDLQWIRVNGAVCGFMIGVVLAVLKMVL